MEFQFTVKIANLKLNLCLWCYGDSDYTDVIEVEIGVILGILYEFWVTSSQATGASDIIIVYTD